jgi:predicted DNA binding CopG/RHH family protein
MHRMSKPRTTISLTDQQVEYLKRKAEVFGISVSEYLRRVIDRDRQENAT